MPTRPWPGLFFPCQTKEKKSFLQSWHANFHKRKRLKQNKKELAIVSACRIIDTWKRNHCLQTTKFLPSLTAQALRAPSQSPKMRHLWKACWHRFPLSIMKRRMESLAWKVPPFNISRLAKKRANNTPRSSHLMENSSLSSPHRFSSNSQTPNTKTS
jgi:hypothetical protein